MKYKLRIPALTTAWFVTEASSEDEALEKVVAGLDTSRVDYADKTCWEIVEVSSDTPKVIRDGIYCRLCCVVIEFGKMKPWRKDDDTLDLLCPGCDSVLVEGE